jgi:hypothetical protein
MSETFQEYLQAQSYERFVTGHDFAGVPIDRSSSMGWESCRQNRFKNEPALAAAKLELDENSIAGAKAFSEIV